jgi:hypothetical protein
MFGDIFVKIFKFIRILYILYKILAIFKVKYFFPIEFGRIVSRITNRFFGKTMENYSMRKNWPLKSSMSSTCSDGSRNSSCIGSSEVGWEGSMVSCGDDGDFSVIRVVYILASVSGSYVILIIV